MGSKIANFANKYKGDLPDFSDFLLLLLYCKRCSPYINIVCIFASGQTGRKKAEQFGVQGGEEKAREEHDQYKSKQCRCTLIMFSV